MSKTARLGIGIKQLFRLKQIAGVVMRGSLSKLIVSGAVALGAVAVVATTSVPLRAADPTPVGLW